MPSPRFAQREFGQAPEEVFDAADEVRGTGILADLAVREGAHFQVGGSEFARRDQNRPERIEALAAFAFQPLTPGEFELEFAPGQRVAGDVRGAVNNGFR